MTPEERADALADELLARGKVPILTRDARALIASAIRDAEDAARRKGSGRKLADATPNLKSKGT